MGLDADCKQSALLTDRCFATVPVSHLLAEKQFPELFSFTLVPSRVQGAPNKHHQFLCQMGLDADCKQSALLTDRCFATVPVSHLLAEKQFPELFFFTLVPSRVQGAPNKHHQFLCQMGLDADCKQSALLTDRCFATVPVSHLLAEKQFPELFFFTLVPSRVQGAPNKHHQFLCQMGLDADCKQSALLTDRCFATVPASHLLAEKQFPELFFFTLVPSRVQVPLK